MSSSTKQVQSQRTVPAKYKQQQIVANSLANPEQFWLEQAHSLITWFQKPTKALYYKDPSKPHFVDWFPDGKLNMCYNAVDRHVENGYGDQVALIYDSPVTQTKRQYTYSMLLEQVKSFSKVLKRYNVNKGDTVIIYMPMIPETLFAMLSCARIGAIHSVVFGGFAPKELAKRIDDCKPKVILSATCGIERSDKIIEYKSLLDEAIKLSQHKPNNQIIFQREALNITINPSAGDVDWVDAVAKEYSSPDVPIEALSSSDVLYMLYTSGTTGMPKGVVRTVGPHAVALMYAMRTVYGSRPGEAFFASSDLGWAVGHSLTCYGALLNRNKTVVYEGKPVGTPDPGAFFRVLEEYDVKVFFTAPTALMILRREDPNGEYRKRYDVSHVRSFFLAGERCVPEIHRWWIQHTTGHNPREKEMSFDHMDELRCVSTDHWWQTESGAPVTALCVGYATSPSEMPPIRFGSAGFPVAGVDLRIIRVHDDEDDENYGKKQHDIVEADPGEIGSVVIKLPQPPGALSTLWNNDERFYNEYFKRFPGYYATGDTGLIDKDGYVFILSRDDDVINVAAHRLSTSAIEEVATEHPYIAECCVVPRPHDIKGQVPMVFAVLKNQEIGAGSAQISKEITDSVRTRVGAIASLTPENVVFIQKLPKTRSGKVLRKMIRTMVAATLEKRQNPNVITIELPATIEDPTVADDIWRALIIRHTKANL
ncbi:hypothetical protein BB559_000949 [Furculomyces boomerangus]|uniref:Propionate--CoA ligase n=1 Tax=Furculomyces boomerangus TaxID=61424 RepID=A0A2T9Z3H8_9FUNG|nr:hypothetical protein BB559_000949 [Furculomyces boomerangus]